MGSPRGFDILGGSEFRLRQLFCFAKQIGAPLRVPSSMGPCYGGIAQMGEHLLCKQGVSGSIPFISTIEIRFQYSAVAECLNLVSKGQNRTLKTEQSNQKYEEQATEGNINFCGTFCYKG